MQKLNQREREDLFEKNCSTFYQLQKDKLSPLEYKKLQNSLSEDILRYNLDADLASHTITQDYTDIYTANCEQLKLFCYDKNKLLLSSTVIAKGDKENVPFDFRNIAALLTADTRTAYFVLMHNHPMAYGAQFSNADYHMAFCSARLGDLINVHLLDFIVVTPFDGISLMTLENRNLIQHKILDFNLGQSLFGEQAILAYSPRLYDYLNLLSNQRRTSQNISYSTTPAKKEDFMAAQKLLTRLLAHTEDVHLRETSMKEIEEELQKWN